VIATHLLQSTVCVGIAAILALALKRAPARTRYGIWLFASLKFLVPLSLLTVVGTYFSTWTPTLTTPTVSVAMRWLDRSLLVWGFDEAAAGGSAGFPGGVNRLALVTLVALWATGVVSLTIWRWRQWRELSALARALPAIEEGREIEALGRVTRMVGRPVRIQLLRCDGSIEPGVLGAFHPKLLWPHGLSDRLSDAELESLLAHEACHVSRRDNLTALIQVVVETVFWFHPIVWWVGSQLVSERERACDEEVLQMGADNRSYAEAILKVCGFGFRAPVAFMAGITGSRLAERIEWILDRQFASTPTLSTRLLLGGIVAATLGVPLAAGALSGHREPTGEGLRLAEPDRSAATNTSPAISVGTARSANIRPSISGVPARSVNARPRNSGGPAKSVNTTPSPQQDAPQVYRPGGGVTAPRLVKEVKPKYNPEAMEAKIQGRIKLEAVVLETGEVGDVEIIESLDKVYGLDDEAVKCITQWLFEPGTKDGKPVAVRVEVEMSFTLK
jgi:TonB family protein